MIIIFILVVIYLLSILKMWNFTKVSYSKDGQWSNLNPEFGDIFFTFAPILNTIAALIELFNSGRRNKEKKANMLIKFFRIRK